VQLSIIIVNYNVRDLLLDAVASLYGALEGGRIDGEIIVVDNASTDGAVDALGVKFPGVITIPLERNLGFGRANNIGIERAHGEYVLLINPDTIVQEETLRTMLDFMNAHPDAAFGGCKILNPDGSFEPASKRGFPSPWSSFCRVFGLSRLFPKSRLFGGYNLTHLDPDSTASVDALSGCFMFCRADVLKQLGGFDIDYFMYGEDLDLCYRAKQLGRKIYYHPATSIVHYKGESTRRSSIDALSTFYEAMEIFARKHFRSNLLLLWLIHIGIRVRRTIARAQERFPLWGFVPVDLASTICGFMIGSTMKFGAPFNYPPWAFPWVILLPPLSFTVMIAATGGYDSDERSPGKALFGYLLGFFLLSTLPYFFKGYAFSRGVVIATTVVATTVGVAARFLWLLYRRTFGAESMRRVAFLSRQQIAPELRKGVRRLFFGKPVTIAGRIAPTFSELDTSEEGVLGTVENIAKIIRSHHLTDIFVIDATLSYGEVLRAMSLGGSQSVRFHITRGSFELIDEPLDQATRTSPLRREGMGRSSIGKRLRDRAIAFFILLFLTPVVYLSSRAPGTRIRQFWEVVVGKRPLVGGSSDDSATKHSALFTIEALGHDEALSQHETSQIESYYATNESLLLDCEIMIAAFRLRNLPRRSEPGPGTVRGTLRQGVR
jgi:GT2 family glycosyltransferase